MTYVNNIGGNATAPLSPVGLASIPYPVGIAFANAPNVLVAISRF